jgi:hypothetical protein
MRSQIFSFPEQAMWSREFNVPIARDGLAIEPGRLSTPVCAIDGTKNANVS